MWRSCGGAWGITISPFTVANIELTGDDDLIQRLRMLGDQAMIAIEGGLFEAAAGMEGTAKELAPVKTGALRASGFAVTTSQVDGTPLETAKPLLAVPETEVAAVVGFGGPAAPYALIQHERTDFHHATGQAKYLETAVQQQAGRVEPIIAARLLREINGLAR